MNILNNNKFREELMNLLIYLENTRGVTFNRTKEEFIALIVKKTYEILDEYQDLLQCLEEDDIFQEIYEIILSMAQYDCERVVDQFENQILITLKRSLEKFLFKNKHIYMPQNIIELMHNYIKTTKKLTTSLGRIPSNEEIAKELQEDIYDIRRIARIYNYYKNGTFVNGLLEDTIFYSTQDDYEFEKKDAVINLIYNSNLTDIELFVVLLTYGIIPPNQKTIYYKDKKVVLDGTPKSFGDIAKITLTSKQNISIIFSRAFCKMILKNNSSNLGIEEYAIDIDLAKKLEVILSYIMFTPYTDKFPNFNSFFSEYNAEEIKNALACLSLQEIKLINDLNYINSNSPRQIYNPRTIKSLYIIIKKVYLELFELYGKRKLIFGDYENNFEQSNIVPSISIEQKNPVPKKNYLFDYISYGDKTIGLYLITKLNVSQRNLLYQMHGSKLNRILDPHKVSKYDNQIIKNYDELLIKLKGLFEETLNAKLFEKEKIKFIEKTLKEVRGRGTGIYKILNYFGKHPAIKEALNLLFDEELELLREVFGQSLNDNNYLANFYKLSNIKQATFSNILIFLKDNLNPVRSKETNKKDQTQGKVFAFYEIFLCEGYSLNDINDVFEEHIDDVYKYFETDTNLELKNQIITTLLDALNNKCSIDYTKRKRKKPNIKELRLSRTYNSLVSNI